MESVHESLRPSCFAFLFKLAFFDHEVQYGLGRAIAFSM